MTRDFVRVQAVLLTASGLQKRRRYFITPTLVVERVNGKFRFTHEGRLLHEYKKSGLAAASIFTTHSNLIKTEPRVCGNNWRRCEDPDLH